MDSGGEEWWSPQSASRRTGLHPETIRKWARGETPRVRSKAANVGKRRKVLVNPEDVLREAALTRPQSDPAPTLSSRSTHLRSGDSDLLDRVAVLEEVVRRHRFIDEHREEIERRHLEISRERREIEELLLGPSQVPDH